MVVIQKKSGELMVLDKTFDTFEEAEIARIRAEKEFYKEFAIHKDLFNELDNL